MNATTKTTGFTQVQQTILNCLNDNRPFVLVSGAYIGDVLSLQCQGYITSEPTDDGKLVVRQAITATEGRK